MIPITHLAHKKVAVFGLGLSGLATIEALLDGGAEVAAWDDGEAGRQRALDAGLPVVDLQDSDWSAYEALVLAPGVPLTHPVPHWTVQKAHQHNIEIIGDTELFFREREALGSKAKVIGITGTNGKSTTTALVSHILSVADYNVQMGGNIGKAILELAPFCDDAIYVIEFSSYQIDLTPSLYLDAGALLNITPDHLDRHGSIENYAKIKSRIFSHLGQGHTAVIGIDDPYCKEIADNLQGAFTKRVVSVTHSLENGIYAEAGHLHVMTEGQEQASLSLDGIVALRGTHNWQNAAGAYELLRGVDVAHDEIISGFKSFPGLEHRMQQIAELGSVRFVNDSKATNADAAAKALGAFNNIYWIAGGIAKEGGIEQLRAFFPHITKAYLIGEAAEDFAAVLGNDVTHDIVHTIEQAVKQATQDAQASHKPEPVILLSPACASFDQFPNFMKRGEAFCNAVYDLPDVTPSLSKA